MLIMLLLLASVAVALLNQAPVQPARTIALVEDGTISLRIMFGQQQTSPRNYDGSLALSQGSVVRLAPFRFFRDDALVGSDSWKLTLKRIPFDNRSGRPNSVAGADPRRTSFQRESRRPWQLPKRRASRYARPRETSNSAWEN